MQEYAPATEVPIFSVDAKGRIIAASEVAVAGISSVGYTSANNNVRISTGDGKTHDLTIADATASIKVSHLSLMISQYHPQYHF